MKTTQSRVLSALPYLLISTVVLLGHGLLLFNNGIFWDDWLIKGFLDENWHLLRDLTSEVGLPILAYFFGALKFLGLSEYYKAVALFLIFFSALIVYQTGLKTGWVNRSEALSIALISAVFPAYQTAVLISTLQYLFFYFLFLLAVLLSFIAEKNTQNKRRYALLHLAAVFLFFLSFNLNSLLVFYFPVLALLFLHIKSIHHLSWSQISFTVIRRIHLVLLPFIYWAIKKQFFPTHGLYEKYNALDFNVIAIIFRVLQTLAIITSKQTFKSLGHLLEHPVIWLTLLILIYAAFIKFKQREKNTANFSATPKAGMHQSKWLFAFGMLLLVSGIFPYAAAGIIPSTVSWNTRHALLTGLPMALIFVAVLRLLHDLELKLFSQWRWKILPGSLSILTVGSLIFAFALSSVSFYIDYQARAIKDQAIMDQLRQTNHIKPFSIYWVKDDFPIGGDSYYNFYEWSSMFKKIWGGQSRIAMQLEYMGNPIDHALPPKAAYSNRYHLADFNPKGPQVCLNIKPGFPELSAEKLVLKYFQLRARAFIQGGTHIAAFNDFVSQTVRIDTKIWSADQTMLAPSAVCSTI